MRVDTASPIASALLAALPKLVRVAAAPAVDVRPAAAAAGGMPPAATSVQMLVALSAAEPAAERRRRSAAGADKGLRQLESLHRELLQGGAAMGRLRELGEWAAALTLPDDPLLAGIARDIELRVRVELAKHELLA